MHNKSLVEKLSKTAFKRAIDIGINVKGHFDWDNHFDVLEKVLEEVGELKEAVHDKTREDTFDEMGDVLFTLAQLARHMSFDPEEALNFAIKKHSIRYNEMTALINQDSKVLTNMTLDQIEPYWVKAKKKTHKSVQEILNKSMK